MPMHLLDAVDIQSSLVYFSSHPYATINPFTMRALPLPYGTTAVSRTTSALIKPSLLMKARRIVFFGKSEANQMKTDIVSYRDFGNGTFPVFMQKYAIDHGNVHLSARQSTCE